MLLQNFSKEIVVVMMLINDEPVEKALPNNVNYSQRYNYKCMY